MALADVEPEDKYATRRGCALGKLIDDMVEEDQLTVGIWLYHRPDFSAAAINKRLKQEFPGWQRKDEVVRLHRRRECGCEFDA